MLQFMELQRVSHGDVELDTTEHACKEKNKK